MNDIEKKAPIEETNEQGAMSMEDVEKTLVQIRPGQIVTGTVVQITDDEVCVNVGYKADGLVKKSDLSSPDVKIGDGSKSRSSRSMTAKATSFSLRRTSSAARRGKRSARRKPPANSSRASARRPSRAACWQM